MSARVTVGIVVYKTPVAQLAGLFDLLQSAAQVRMVLVFDNGVDPALAQEVARRGWVYRTEGRNLGFGSGHNRLIGLLSAYPEADLHLLCNPDILWHDNPLPALTGYLDRHPGVVAVMPDVQGLDGERQYLAKRKPTPFILFGRRFLPRRWIAGRVDHYEMRDLDFSRDHVVPIISGCFMLLRTAALRAVGGFDERYFLYLEDYDLCRRLQGQGGAVALAPQARVLHGHTRSSYSWGWPLWWHIRSAFRYFLT
ncbi:glycosyltransferase family 2 protein [Chitiniphilus purpureus]|uniref:Glycosyltransferase family 2 protein n=1 Tax=Chitiniphilus purpureus TaxID=2981137 RepID=A0ABY6DMX2_9NEIS|nr:glycosyltransferase family 2 protein [Chitiniphilus sp. CD1]UXY15558.1 glycosyltransferase family 2 protein [Chitiniphilus sp. CD1]